jgi:hypothetical protein
VTAPLAITLSARETNVTDRYPHFTALDDLREFATLADLVVAPEPRDFAAFDSLREAFAVLVSPDFVRRVVNADLKNQIEREFVNESSGTHETMNLHVGANCSLRLALYSPKPAAATSIYEPSEHMMLGVVGPGPIRLRHFAIPASRPNRVFDRSFRPVETQTLSAAPGEVVSFEAGRHMFDVVPPDVSTVVVCLSSTQCSEFIWEYDARTLEPLRVCSANLAETRLVYSIELVAQLGSPTSVEALADVSAHHAHNVRWAVVKAMLRIDRDRGITLLRAALSDVHPHVRNAAESTLRRYHLLEEVA